MTRTENYKIGQKFDTESMKIINLGMGLEPVVKIGYEVCANYKFGQKFDTESMKIINFGMGLEPVVKIGHEVSD